MDFGQIHGWNNNGFYRSDLSSSEIFLDCGMFILLIIFQFSGGIFLTGRKL